MELLIFFIKIFLLTLKMIVVFTISPHWPDNIRVDIDGVIVTDIITNYINYEAH